MGQTTYNRRAKYQQAFNEVLEGYENTKYRSEISAMGGIQEGGRTTSNPARPTQSDFVCDVENAILFVVKKTELLKKIIDTYIMGEEGVLTKSRQHHFEQRIGKIFEARNIWPINKYFLTIRKA